MADSLDMTARAVGRALELLAILNREHTCEQLHERARAVRHELETAQGLLSAFASDIPAPRPGKASSGAPETSKAAARAIRTRSGSQRHQLLRVLARRHDLTDFQLQWRTSIGASSQRPRRLELLEAGYIEAARDGDGNLVTVRHPESKLECQAWRITDKGRAALTKLNAGQMVLMEVGT